LIVLIGRVHLFGRPLVASNVVINRRDLDAAIDPIVFFFFAPAFVLLQDARNRPASAPASCSLNSRPTTLGVLEVIALDQSFDAQSMNGEVLLEVRQDTVADRLRLRNPTPMTRS